MRHHINMEKDKKRVEYVIYQCPYCGAKMSFKREPKPRTEHTVCAICGKEMDVEIK